MNTPRSKAHVSKDHQLALSELITAARYRGMVTYQEIAKLLGLPLEGNYMGAAIGSLLGEISVDEVRQGRPMLSAIVVTTLGHPGPGFFNLARDLGRLKGTSRDDELRFWKKEVHSVHETWRTVLRR